MDLIFSIPRTGAAAFGCEIVDLPRVDSAQDMIEFCLGITSRSLFCLIGIIIIIYRTAARFFYYIFPCLRGLKPMEPEPAADPLVVGFSKGANFQRVAIQVDFSDPKNTNQEYFQNLCIGNNIDWNSAGGNKNEIQGFFIGLYQRTPGLRNLSPANQAALRQRTIATMNALNRMRNVNDEQFREQLKATFERMNDALHHCMNNINPTFETIMYDVLANTSGGSMAQRVQMALQSFRQNCLAAAVRNVLDRIQDQQNKQYHLGHEAASMTYYLKRLYGELDLPEPAAVHDNHYEFMAFQNREDAVLEEFNRLYTPTTVLDHICNNIGINPILPRAMFIDWMRKANKILPELEDDMHLQTTSPTGQKVRIYDANGVLFQKFLIRDYLLEIGVLAR